MVYLGFGDMQDWFMQKQRADKAALKLPQYATLFFRGTRRVRVLRIFI